MIKLIKIKVETKKALDAIKHPGQTYDGIIRELIDKARNGPAR